jgi:hypothetical protein
VGHDSDRNPLSQYQSLALLAATIRWLSTESGRSETEILEVLAANFRYDEDQWQQELNNVLARVHCDRVDAETA